jgi:hypothetical protein
MAADPFKKGWRSAVLPHKESAGGATEKFVAFEKSALPLWNALSEVMLIAKL